MITLLRCPECGKVDVLSSIRYFLRYVYSSHYRRAQKELAECRKTMASHLMTSDTIHIPHIGLLRGVPGDHRNP